MTLVPKVCGADIELGNFTLSGGGAEGDGTAAAQIVLREIRRLAAALPRTEGIIDRWQTERIANPRDWARSHFPTNGGCAYIDADHLELCIPEVWSAWDHVACWHAMLRITQRALANVNAERDAPDQIQLFANNGDGLGLGNSWGSHLNFLVSRRAWHELLERKAHYLAWLAAFQISAIVYTGQGRVGSEIHGSRIRYQIAQRAEFFETLVGWQTTHRRPIVNTRDEALSGADSALATGDRSAIDLARLHVIFFDNTLAQVACLLRVGVMQIALAMLEAGHVQPELALDDPIAALRTWSRDPNLLARAPLMSGESVTAVELQRRFLDQAERFVQSGRCEGIVPRAAEIVALWSETLDQLDRRDWPALARRIDWVLKLSLLERALEQRTDLAWSAADLLVLDHLYSSLDPAQGLYWSIASGGQLDEVVSPAAIDWFTNEPPSDTRAWGRTMLLRKARPNEVDHVDWDEVRLLIEDRAGDITRWRIDLGTPLDATRDAWHELLSAGNLADTIAALRGRLVLTTATTTSARADDWQGDNHERT